MAVQPFTEGLCFRVGFFDLFITQDPLLLCIHQEHFARVKPFFFHDMAFIQIQHPDLRRKDQPAVIHHVIPGRSEAVAVQDRSHHISVGEKNGRRSVPGLHHGRIILVKVSLLLGKCLIVYPWLRDQDHRSQRQIHTAHHQKLQGVVQHGGIGAALGDHRKYLGHIFFGKGSRMHRFFPGQHLVRVSFDRIDLTVVDDQPVRMGSLPARHRIGGKT